MYSRGCEVITTYLWGTFIPHFCCLGTHWRCCGGSPSACRNQDREGALATDPVLNKSPLALSCTHWSLKQHERLAGCRVLGVEPPLSVMLWTVLSTVIFFFFSLFSLVYLLWIVVRVLTLLVVQRLHSKMRKQPAWVGWGKDSVMIMGMLDDFLKGRLWRNVCEIVCMCEKGMKHSAV